MDAPFWLFSRKPIFKRKHRPVHRICNADTDSMYRLVPCLYQDEQRKPSPEFINITLEPDITTNTSAIVLNIVFLYIEHNRTDRIIKKFINIHNNTIYRIISSEIYIQE